MFGEPSGPVVRFRDIYDPSQCATGCRAVAQTMLQARVHLKFLTFTRPVETSKRATLSEDEAQNSEVTEEAPPGCASPKTEPPSPNGCFLGKEWALGLGSNPQTAGVAPDRSTDSPPRIQFLVPCTGQ
jgi:hypothetical protein